MKTAECVSPSHPDKLCDRISDAILDACLEQDPMSRVAIETMGGHGIITITGELTTKAWVNIPEVVKKIVGDKYGIQTNIVQQSPEIAQGVDTGGAGDQGCMAGYACNDNESMIPQELYLARSLCKFIYSLHPYDGKTQITINDDGIISTIVVSFQNVLAVELNLLINDWLSINKFPVTGDYKVRSNSAGDWKIGGFEADTGVTGRKLMVDNYGPQIAVGGGCFSGKDATKVDRSAAYMARKIAVDYLKQSPEAKEVFVKLAYAIGVAQPVMVTIKIIENDNDVREMELPPTGIYDLTPKGIIDYLELRKPGFEKTAQWGHMGNNFLWDKTNE